MFVICVDSGDSLDLQSRKVFRVKTDRESALQRFVRITPAWPLAATNGSSPRISPMGTDEPSETSRIRFGRQQESVSGLTAKWGEHVHLASRDASASGWFSMATHLPA